MCDICKNVREHGNSFAQLANGGITDDPHGTVALEMRKKTKSLNSNVIFVVHAKEPGEQVSKTTEFRTPVLYCPFCGEKF